MPFMDLETGVRLHYRDGGSGRPIVFVPGFAATSDAWNYQLDDLSDRFRCISVDLRGHGRSEAPLSEYTYGEMCGDLAALLGRLELHDVILVGWSMGAGVVLSYVLDHDADRRVARVCFVAPATPRFTQTETEPFGMDAATAAASLEGIRRAYPETMAAFADANFHRTDREDTKQWFLRSWLELPAYAARRYFRTLLEVDLRERLGEVNLPVLVCQGRHDQVTDPRWAQYLVSGVADAQLVWFEESGHSLMVEEPDKLSESLASFAG